MKKLLSLFLLIPLFWVTPLTVATTTADTDEEVVIEDETDPNATINYVTLIWDPNSENNIAGYNVYYGRAPGTYSRLETVGEATARIGVRGFRPLFFAVTAFDTNGAESDFSEEVQWP